MLSVFTHASGGIFPGEVFHCVTAAATGDTAGDRHDTTHRTPPRFERRRMDFIETIFGFAPDGGDGSFEFLLFLIPISLIGAVWALRRRKAQRRRHDE